MGRPAAVRAAKRERGTVEGGRMEAARMAALREVAEEAVAVAMVARAVAEPQVEGTWAGCQCTPRGTRPGGGTC